SPLVSGLSLGSTIAGGLLGAGVMLVFYLGGRLLYRGAEPLGSGDVTIAAIMGCMVGYPRVVIALFLGSLASAAFGLAAMVVGRGGRRTYIPYGPGLCLGALVAFFVGP